VIDVAHLGHDDLDTLDLGEWVELVDDSTLLERQSLALRRVTPIDPVKLLVTLDAQPERPSAPPRAPTAAPPVGPAAAREGHDRHREHERRPRGDIRERTASRRPSREAAARGSTGCSPRVGAGIDWPTNRRHSCGTSA
jgi:hypothetical protein